MKKKTYVAGSFSQISLDDGSSFFLATLASNIRIDKMFLMFPIKTIWRYTFPFYIRTNPSPDWETAEELLDLVLEKLADCRTHADLLLKLPELDLAMDNYVIANFESAMSYAVSKIGDEWASEAERKWTRPKIWLG